MTTNKSCFLYRGEFNTKGKQRERRQETKKPKVVSGRWKREKRKLLNSVYLWGGHRFLLVKTRENLESTEDCEDTSNCRRWKTREFPPGGLNFLGKTQGKI